MPEVILGPRNSATCKRDSKKSLLEWNLHSKQGRWTISDCLFTYLLIYWLGGVVITSLKKIEIVKRNLEGQGIGFVVQNRVVRKSLVLIS